MVTLSENITDENLIILAYPILLNINENDCSRQHPYKV